MKNVMRDFDSRWYDGPRDGSGMKVSETGILVGWVGSLSLRSLRDGWKFISLSNLAEPSLCRLRDIRQG